MSFRRFRGILLGIILVFLSGGPARAEGPVITEFLAVNDSSLMDQDGDHSDWIEIYNPDPASVNLAGWSLSDDKKEPGKWKFPDVELPPGQFLIVFASGKDRSVAGAELHTNFQLSSVGEFLGLFAPNGAPASFYLGFPPQLPDASFGMWMPVTRKTPVAAGATARYFLPQTNDLTTTWFKSDFDDSTWQSGPTGIGFDLNPTPALSDLIQTDLSALVAAGLNSLYVRIPFDVDPGDAGAFLVLRAKYDDGIIVYINGTEVTRRNFGALLTLRYTSRASVDRSVDNARTFESTPIFQKVLEPGRNVLAIQVLGKTLKDLDLLLVPELDLVRVEGIQTNVQGYFDVPTPAFPNAEPLPGVADEPVFSQLSGVYAAGLKVELGPAAPGSEIHLTVDGSIPTKASPAYTEPISITGPTVVRARGFRDGLLPSGVLAESYMLADATFLKFNSNIPVFIVSTLGKPFGSNCGGGPYTPGQLMIFSPGQDGRARVTDEVQLAGPASFRRRGSSTCGDPKFSFNVKILNSRGTEEEVPIFGMPADADWIMYSPYNFDRALMRNAVAYWMSRQVGQWAARTQFVECFFHSGTGPVNMASYVGVYIFMEKCKRGPERINVERLTSSENQEPQVTGGYILKRDRIGSGEVATSAGGYGSLVFVYPKQPSTAQQTYITNYINKAIASLSPSIGSQADTDLIDVQGWLDHHILCLYPKNVDAFRLSGYMYKTRGGPFVMGPVWDYDRTMGCADDDRAVDPIGYYNPGGTLYFEPGDLGSWYSFLFQNKPPLGTDPWARAYRARWREIRNGPLRTETIVAQINSWGAELAEAAVRNFTRWPGTAPRYGSFQGEVNHLRDWLTQRAAWMDSQFIEPPTLSPPGGLVSEGLQVTISAMEGQIYYTLNGPDPMAAGGAVAPEALPYSGPITISQNTRIRARIRVGVGSWSEMAQDIYVTKLLPLVITEVMYNPAVLPGDTQPKSQYTYIELMNIGNEPIQLDGVSLPAPVVYNFTGSAVTTLNPGEYVVIAKNLTAFLERYGDGPKVAGAYGRPLNVTRGDITLLGPLGETLLKLHYEDSWYPSTDGQGNSLVIRDPLAPRESWLTKEGWRESYEAGGSPGREDVPGPSPGLQLSGDINQDQRRNISDAVGMLAYLFQGYEVPCSSDEGNLQLLDVNGDKSRNVTDAIYTLQYLFGAGDPPALGVGCVPIAGCPDVCKSGN